MITDKFNKDFSKGNKNVTKIIEDIVADYFLKEKVTEESLRVLKQNVAKSVENYKRDNKSEKSNKSVISKNDLDQRNADDKSNKAPSHRNEPASNYNNNQKAQKDSQSVRSGRSS